MADSPSQNHFELFGIEAESPIDGDDSGAPLPRFNARRPSRSACRGGAGAAIAARRGWRRA